MFEAAAVSEVCEAAVMAEVSEAAAEAVDEEEEEEEEAAGEAVDDDEEEEEAAVEAVTGLEVALAAVALVDEVVEAEPGAGLEVPAAAEAPAGRLSESDEKLRLVEEKPAAAQLALVVSDAEAKRLRKSNTKLLWAKLGLGLELAAARWALVASDASSWKLTMMASAELAGAEREIDKLSATVSDLSDTLQRHIVAAAASQLCDTLRVETLEQVVTDAGIVFRLTATIPSPGRAVQVEPRLTPS